MGNLYYYDVCAIMVIVLLIHIVYIRRNIDARTNHVLLRMMIISLISHISDLVAAIAENGVIGGQAGVIVANLANYVYFIFHPFIFPMYVLYIYASFDLWNVFKRKTVSQIIWWALIICNLLVLATNPFTHAIFYITDKAEFVRGYLHYVYYVVAFIYAGLGDLVP